MTRGGGLATLVLDGGQESDGDHRGAGGISPFRYIIDAMREAYLGHYFNTIMIEGIAVAAGMALLFLWLGSRVFVQENA